MLDQRGVRSGIDGDGLLHEPVKQFPAMPGSPVETERELVDRRDRPARNAPGEARKHHDVTILLSWPGVGVRIAATMLAEAHEALSRRDDHAMRTLSGLAPVTEASGKYRIAKMRYACNQRLRTACYHWARTAMPTDPHARLHYDQLRRRGHTHARALRGLADRQLLVLIAMLQSGTCYDTKKRTARQDAA